VPSVDPLLGVACCFERKAQSADFVYIYKLIPLTASVGMELLCCLDWVDPGGDKTNLWIT